MGGSSYTTLIATINPRPADAEETLNTLQFANRCKNVITQPHINYLNADPESQTKIIEKLMKEIAALRDQLSAQKAHYEEKLRTGGGGRGISVAPVVITRTDSSASVGNVSSFCVLADLLFCFVLLNFQILKNPNKCILDIGRGKRNSAAFGMAKSRQDGSNAGKTNTLSSCVHGRTLPCEGGTTPWSPSISRPKMSSWSLQRIVKIWTLLGVLAGSGAAAEERQVPKMGTERGSRTGWLQSSESGAAIPPSVTKVRRPE